MISGVATNLKSRLSQLNSSPSHHNQQPQEPPPKVRTYSPSREVIKQRPSPTHVGEQSPSLIPLTVPGADSTMPSFPYGKNLIFLIAIFHLESIHCNFVRTIR